MAMKLENVVPFGRSLDEYKKMFALSERELSLNILGVADGPASFNAELSALGGRATSVDPLYVFQAPQIKARFDEVLDHIIAQVEATPADWVWSYHGSPAGLRANRIRVTDTFIADFGRRRDSGCYLAGELPELPFSDRQFDLALCSHFLFLYSEHFSLEFHRASIREMLRVAGEVRIFPLLTLMLEKSPHLAAIHEVLTKENYVLEIRQVEYELQKGGNQMLVIKSGK
ncbi:class I SAM-dependent methyltransferase [Methylococcus sp. EFPC2]|uniref:class I SAM-dependent methyltransferase n=1 Tax=Methylococcus sp. EFPC2 TaxID=2812648 RepID=UPI001966E360|nr:class I SAM-dependent methyltransferase [Methylococcus sp. EFPC2]QSA95625.1 class I SAM-dependent methyltransferase [Methylococcus sp. EFPC2]